MIKFKATEGNIEKLNLIKSEFPNQDTITSSELKSIPALLSPSAKKPVCLAYFITDESVLVVVVFIICHVWKMGILLLMMM